MPAASELKIKISADAAAAEKGLASVQAKVARFSSAAAAAESKMAGLGNLASRVGSGLSSLGTRLTIGVTLPVLGVGAALVKMASDASESENLFAVSMGSMAEEARRWSESISEALGLNAYAVREQVGTFNNMFNSMKLGTEASYEMSKGLTQLAYDLSSFYNLPTDVAFEKLRAGIMGETEPLRQLGIVVDETTLKNWALTNGLIRQGDEMSQAQKILARYGLIMESTANAQGDLARTGDSVTNQIRRVQNQFAQTAIEVGREFLPTVAGALQWINDTGFPTVRGGLRLLQTSWAEMSDDAKTKIVAVAGLLIVGGPLMKGIGISIGGVQLLSKAFAVMAGLVPAKIGIIATAVAMMAATVWQFADQIGSAMQDFGNTLTKLGDAAGVIGGQVGAYGAALSAFGSLLADAGGSLRQVRAEVGGMDQVVGNVFDTIDSEFEAALGQAKEFAFEGLGGINDQLNEIAMWDKANHLSLSESLRISQGIAKQSNDELMQMPDILDMIKDAWAAAAGAGEEGAKEMGKAARDMSDELRNALGGFEALIAEAVRLNPAMQAVTARVNALKLAIVAVQDQIQANQEATRQAQEQLRGMQERASQLANALSEARQRLEELSRPRLVGMGEMEEQMFQIEQQIKRLRLQEMGADISLFQPMTEQARAFVGTLPNTVEGLEQMLEAMRLQQSLRYDEQLRRLQEAAQGTQQEMTYTQALQSIVATKNEIVSLEGQVRSANAAVAAQEAHVRQLEAASRALNQQLQILQQQLQQEEERQRLVNDALMLAYTWYIQDREKITEMGAEGVRVAEIIDEKTAQLLIDIQGQAEGSAASAIEALQSIIREYNVAKSTVAAGIHIPVYYDRQGEPSGGGGGGGEEAEGMQYGGHVNVGDLYRIHEAGLPEFFRPSVPGEIIPLGRVERAGGGDVYVTVQGSVITIKDLARELREELLRTSKRNVYAGLA